jgi:hypothetical protein
LSIPWDQESSPPRLKLPGRVSGAWVGELERAWLDARATGSHPVVDLTDVTFVGREGRSVLGEMLREGAQLMAGPLMQFTIDRIRREANDLGENTKRGD